MPQHFFLQRLPQIPHLCSLYIPYIANHIYCTYLNAKDLALQLVDIVAIRPEIQLLYLALSNTCFELLENLDSDKPGTHPSTSSTDTGSDELSPMSEHVDDNVDESNHEMDENNSIGTSLDDPSAAAQLSSGSDDGSNAFDDSDEDVDECDKKLPILKLREIPFNDDNVSIFKARHGRL